MSGRSRPRSSMGVITETSDGRINLSPRSRTLSPTSNDDEYDTDLEVEEEKSTFDLTGRSLYIDACKQHGLVPASYFLRHMQDDTLNMQHHGLGAIGVKVMALSLMNNTSVISLNLEDNWLEGEGGESVSKMLKENCYIAELNIAWNKLGRRGAIAVCDMLMSNTTLQVLNVAGNEFTDAEAGFFADALNENNRVRILNISHNHFGDKTAAILGPAISENDTVEEIDLSWNYFRPPGSKHLCDGLKTNIRLKTVDLSFNGVGNDGAVGVADILKLNQALLELRLSHNRISTAGALLIAKAMEANEILKTLKLDHNPLGVDGAKAILKAMMSDNCGITHLDMSGVEVDKEFVALKKEYLEKKDVTILHGMVLGDYVIKPRKKKVNATLFGVPMKDVNPDNVLQHLQCYCDGENVNICDAFVSLDKKREHRLSSTDIVSGLMTSGLTISDEQINYFVHLLGDLEDGDGFVDISQFTA